MGLMPWRMDLEKLETRMEINYIIDNNILNLVAPEYRAYTDLLFAIFVGLALVKIILSILQSNPFLRVYSLLSPVTEWMNDKLTELNTSPIERSERYIKFAALIDMLFYYPMTVFMGLTTVFCCWVSLYAFKVDAGLTTVLGSFFVAICAGLMARFCKVAGDKGLDRYRNPRI